MAPAPPPRVEWHEYGDAGLLAEISTGDDKAVWLTAQALGSALREERPVGLVDVVASFRTVFVSFDPLLTDHDTMRSAATGVLGRTPAPREPRTFTIPVRYGGESGPDLDAVARELHLDPRSVIDLHTSADWVVRVIASPVGAPLMDGPRAPASIARMHEPRARVEPGSVGLSGFQSIIYPVASPGGWRLIGRTPAVLVDLDQPPYAAHRPGDRIRFRSITADEGDA